MLYFLLLTILLVPVAANAQIHIGRASALDGDTLTMGNERIRLAGIDALEKDQTCTRGDEVTPCGEEARALLSQLIDGKPVECEQDTRDAYGHIVAACHAGGIDLARAMIEGGYALAMPEMADTYGVTEKLIRAAKIGAWSSEFAEPAAWRAAHPQQAMEHHEGRATPRPATTRWRVHFRNCADARRAGAAPIYRGQPGYRSPLDADGDGVACEPYKGR